MPMYAPGCEMDKLYRPPNNRNNRSKSKLPVVLIIIVLVFIFAPSFTPNPIELTNQVPTMNAEQDEMQICFTFTNTTIGLIFNPQYTIDILDEAGNISFTSTNKACNVLLPRQSIEVNTVVPITRETDRNYQISFQTATFRPY